MNSPPPFTLRIRTEQEQDIDWMVQPDEITFHQALVIFFFCLCFCLFVSFLQLNEDYASLRVYAYSHGPRLIHVVQFILIHPLESTVLENVDSIKYLGVTITNHLKWNTHITNICTKANRTHKLDS